MLEVCGETESRLATELMQHELQMEKDILDPLNQLAEVKKQKQKKNTDITHFMFHKLFGICHAAAL